MHFKLTFVAIALLGFAAAAPIATSGEHHHHTTGLIQRDPKEAAANAYPTHIAAEEKRDPKEAAANAYPTHIAEEEERDVEKVTNYDFPVHIAAVAKDEKRAPHEEKVEGYKLKRNPNEDSIAPPTKCQSQYKRDGAATNACPVPEDSD